MVAFITERTDCRACGGALETVLDLGEQEVISLGDKERRSAPLVVTKCQKCDLVQLRHSVDRDFLFRTYYYRSGATQTMKDHLKGIVDEAQKRANLKSGDIIIDIGANDGTLLSFFPNSGKKGVPELPPYKRFGFEPARVFFSKWEKAMWGPNDYYVSDSFHMINNFFNTQELETFLGPDKAKLIFAIAMFYDLEDPNKFLRDVKKVLAPDGLFVLQVNYLPDLLKNNAIGDIVHEHLEYYSLQTLGRLLARHDLDLDEVSFNEINGGSMRCYIHHRLSEADSYAAESSVGKAVIKEETLGLDTLKPYQDFAARLETIAAKLRGTMLAYTDMGKTIDVLGSSTRGSTLIQYAKLQPYFRYCVERDASKVGKTYLGLPIVGEGAEPPDYYFVSPVWFLEEIKKRYPNSNLIVPLPTPRVIFQSGESTLL